MLFHEVILTDPLKDTKENRKTLLGLFATEASSLNSKIVLAKVTQLVKAGFWAQVYHRQSYSSWNIHRGKDLSEP